jgi:enterochelin esterase-like enzyme
MEIIMRYKDLYVLNNSLDEPFKITFYKEGEKTKKTLLATKFHPYNHGVESYFKVDLDKYDRLIIKQGKLSSLPIYLNEFTPDLMFNYTPSKEYLNVKFYLHGKRKTGKIETLSFRSKALNFRKYYLRAYVYTLTYDKSKPYSLILGYDGQNLFSKNGVGKYTKGDPYGSWQLDVVLNKVQEKTKKNYIVVSVDNATYYREKELMVEPTFGKINPRYADNPVHHHGRLTSFNKFIFEELFEEVYKKYQIDFNDVGVLGSSMGGIASFYTSLVHSDFFKYAISLSPALGFFNQEAYEKIYKDNLPKMYIGGGNRDELEKYLSSYNNAYVPYLEKHFGKDKYRYQFIEEYNHNEIAWRYFLVDALDFIYNK